MAERNPDSTTRHTFNMESIRNANVVATIDFHRTLIYVLGAAGEDSPERIEDVDYMVMLMKLRTGPAIPMGRMKPGMQITGGRSARPSPRLAPSCCLATGMERQMRHTNGSPMRRSIVKTLQQRSSPTFARILMTSPGLRSSNSLIATSRSIDP